MISYELTCTKCLQSPLKNWKHQHADKKKQNGKLLYTTASLYLYCHLLEITSKVCMYWPKVWYIHRKYNHDTTIQFTKQGLIKGLRFFSIFSFFFNTGAIFKLSTLNAATIKCCKPSDIVFPLPRYCSPINKYWINPTIVKLTVTIGKKQLSKRR